MNAFSKRLKELRKEKKLSQRAMAKLLDISQPTYLYWEQGKTEPNIANIQKLCKLFGVTADYILGLEGEGGEKLY